MGWDNAHIVGDDETGTEDRSALDRIFRKTHGINDKEKQAAAKRTRDARERGRQARVKAQRERAAKKK